MSNASNDFELGALDINVSLEFGRIDSTLIEVFPIDAFKPGVVLERHEGGSSQASLRLILVQQLLHQLPGLLILQRPGILQL